MRVPIERFPLDEGTDRRLRNWGACMRDDAFTPSRCRSIEGRYDRTAEDENGPRKTSSRAPSMARDHEDAMVIDRVIRHPAFPEFERLLLRAHYLHRDRSEKTCRALSIRWREYDDRVARAVQMVRNRLTVAERRWAIDTGMGRAYKDRDTADTYPRLPACATTAPATGDAARPEVPEPTIA